ncbi:MAG: Gfo/Idh/MocA family oxidoreductase [Deltaproteobacteria bacterium]|nr:Gfo/Idh/MocA family oxidoreductase [Deltaproteobacteria bacterium]MBW2360619.1 Gfo/Idh/MocA family oxidoreductase [Deltaproteobacteria bacterium]
MDKAFRLFVLGAGTIARSHAEAACALGRDVELHAADPSPTAREAFAAAFPATTLHENVEQMLAPPARDSDIAIVATPPWLHREQIELAARSGRHVLCEKPLLISAQEIEPVAEVLRETGRALVCCSTRFLPNPATRQVCELIQQGRLGEIYSVNWRQILERARSGIEWQPESPWFLDKSKNGGGCLMDWAAYDLAILHDLLQPHAVTVAHAALARPELPAELPPGSIFDVETHGLATLIYERADGSRVPVQYERATGSFEPGVEEARVTGTRGSVSWTCLGYDGRIELSHRDAANEKGRAESFAAPGELWSARAPLVETLNLLEGRPHHAVAGADALFQAAVLRAIYRAAETGAPVSVRRADFADVPDPVTGSA